MLERIPDDAEMTARIGAERYGVWRSLCALIERSYDMEREWNRGGKAWDYEYKYRRGGKTLCALYARTDCFGFMVIFGKDERAKFEAQRDGFSARIRSAYDAAKTYHDGKWVMFEPDAAENLGDYVRLLGIKRRPNRA